MEEEENKDVDDEGGTVITRSSVVVKFKNCIFLLRKPAFNRLRWQIIPIDVQLQEVAKQETEAGGGTSIACDELVGWVFQRKR